MKQRILIVILAVLGGIAVASGLYGIVLGPALLPGGGPVPPTVDSEYRFVNVFWLSAGLALWWSLRRPSARAQITRAVLIIAAAGGLARVISIIAVGWPNVVFIASLLLEVIGVPILLVFHTRLLRSTAPSLTAVENSAQPSRGNHVPDSEGGSSNNATPGSARP